MQPFFEKREFTREKPLIAREGSSLRFLAHWQLDFEFLFVLEGVQGMAVNNVYRVLGPGDLGVCRSRDVHYYDDAPGPGRFVMAFVDAGFMRTQAGWPDRDATSSPFLSLPEAEPLFRRLAEEDDLKRPYHEVAMKAALLDIVAAILRTGAGEAEASRAAGTPDPALARVQTALSFLETHFAEDLTHDGLAERLSISPSYFSRIFNRATGMGFREYLNHLRVTRAQEMLAAGGRSVTDIAFACGFGSLRTFHRAFRDVAGRSPLEGAAGRSCAESKTTGRRWFPLV